MRRIIMQASLTLLFSIISLRPAEAQPSFTVEQCIDFAMKKNPLLLATAMDTLINQLEMKRISGEYIPTIDLSASLQYYLLKRYTIVEGTSVVAPDNIGDYDPYALELGYRNAWFPTINAGQLIYDPSHQPRHEMNAVNTLLSKQQLAKLKIDLITAIYKSFATCLVLEAHESFLKENLMRTDTLVRFTHEKFEEGVALKFEVNQMEVTSNRIRNALIQVQGFYDESMQQLRVLMNYHTADSLRLLSDFTTQLIISSSESFLDSIPNSVASDRIEYHMIQSKEQLSIANLSVTKSRSGPYLSLNGMLGFNPQASHIENMFQQERWKPYSYIGLNLFFPVFQGLDVKRNAEQAKIQISQAGYDLASFENQYAGERDNSFLQLKKSLALMTLADSTLRLSEENVYMLKEALDYGLVTTLHVIVGENDLFLNQSQYFAQLLEVTLNNINARHVRGDFNGLAGF